MPVSSAFGTAVAISILASELKNFCGLNYKSNQFTESLGKFHGHISEIKVGDLSLGVTSTVILILLGVSTTLRRQKFTRSSTVFSRTNFVAEIERLADLKIVSSSRCTQEDLVVRLNQQERHHPIYGVSSD